jgi:hypothetical protein
MAPNSKNDDGCQFARATSTCKPNCVQIRRFLYYGGYFVFKIAAIANQTIDMNSQHHNLLRDQFRPNQRIFVFWWPFWIQNGHHSKPTMDVNSQHHNLLGSQISSKSEEFCILATIFLAFFFY